MRNLEEIKKDLDSAEIMVDGGDAEYLDHVEYYELERDKFRLEYKYTELILRLELLVNYGTHSSESLEEIGKLIIKAKE